MVGEVVVGIEIVAEAEILFVVFGLSAGLDLVFEQAALEIAVLEYL